MLGIWATFLGLSVGIAQAQQQLPGVGFPHYYPGKPRGDYSPAWQQCEPFIMSEL